MDLSTAAGPNPSEFMIDVHLYRAIGFQVPLEVADPLVHTTGPVRRTGLPGEPSTDPDDHGDIATKVPRRSRRHPLWTTWAPALPASERSRSVTCDSAAESSYDQGSVSWARMNASISANGPSSPESRLRHVRRRRATRPQTTSVGRAWCPAPIGQGMESATQRRSLGTERFLPYNQPSRRPKSKAPCFMMSSRNCRLI